MHKGTYVLSAIPYIPLQWRHNEGDGVVRAHIKENIKASRHWPFRGNPPVTDEFPSQRASDAEMFQLDDVIMQ